MRIIFYALAVGMSAIVTFALCVVILKLSHRYRLYPKIRERDMHKRPTPRLGGVAMFVGVVVAIAVSSQLPTFDIVFSEPVKV
jgi:UDP-GlcNAc:undecaprenyl-phosphate/decaprenyl-phosphate GlcNAc-1-phosphate transferase